MYLALRSNTIWFANNITISMKNENAMPRYIPTISRRLANTITKHENVTLWSHYKVTNDLYSIQQRLLTIKSKPLNRKRHQCTGIPNAWRAVFHQPKYCATSRFSHQILLPSKSFQSRLKACIIHHHHSRNYKSQKGLTCSRSRIQ